MAEWFELSVVIRPAVRERGIIEDDLMELLGKHGLGEVNGAGAATDGSFCDLDISVTNLDEGLRVIREVLRRHNVPLATVINYHGPELVRYTVYD